MKLENANMSNYCRFYNNLISRGWDSKTAEMYVKNGCKACSDCTIDGDCLAKEEWIKEVQAVLNKRA